MSYFEAIMHQIRFRLHGAPPKTLLMAELTVTALPLHLAGFQGGVILLSGEKGEGKLGVRKGKERKAGIGRARAFHPPLKGGDNPPP